MATDLKARIRAFLIDTAVPGTAHEETERMGSARDLLREAMPGMIEALPGQTCIACGWELTHPFLGRTVAPEQIFRLTMQRGDGAAPVEFGIHAICILREGPQIGYQLKAVAGLIDGETEELTPLGHAAVKAGRVA